MQTRRRVGGIAALTTLVTLAALVMLAGCSGQNQEYHPVTKGVTVKAPPPHEHEHGPHSGHLVELGEEEHHAEVVFDAKSAKLTIYILDSTAKKAEPIDAKDVALKLTIDGKSAGFKLPAVPDAGDPQGKSSRFELGGDPDIKAHIKDEEDLKGAVSVTIANKSFTGDIKHEH
jgi:hypothetical protein